MAIWSVLQMLTANHIEWQGHSAIHILQSVGSIPMWSWDDTQRSTRCNTLNPSPLAWFCHHLCKCQIAISAACFMIMISFAVIGLRLASWAHSVDCPLRTGQIQRDAQTTPGVCFMDCESKLLNIIISTLFFNALNTTVVDSSCKRFCPPR